MPDMVTMADGSKVVAPANIVLSCAPPGREARMIRPGQYAVTDMDKMEATTQPLYSILTYAAAGQTSLTFFQNPVGSGTTPLTLADTNMQSAGMLPAPQKFLITGIGVRFISSLAASTLGAASANSPVYDTNKILQSGILRLTISSKDYLTVSPLVELPARSYVAGMAGLSNATTAAASLASVVSLAWVNGDVFKPNPLLLESSMNFSVTIQWPTAVAVPSTDATSKIGVWLYGILYRPPQ